MALDYISVKKYLPSFCHASSAGLGPQPAFLFRAHHRQARGMSRVVKLKSKKMKDNTRGHTYDFLS